MKLFFYILVNYCAKNPCLNGGECCSTTSAYQCTCPANTIEPNCASGKHNFLSMLTLHDDALILYHVWQL